MKAEIKPFYDTKRIPLHKVLPLDTPFTIHIQTSTICNLRCKYCFQSLNEEEKRLQKFEPKIMDLGLFAKIVEQVKEFPGRVKDISFLTMGEPLCNKNLTQMIRMVKDSDIANRIHFFTNGLLLTEQLSLELVDAGLDELRVSLQGMNSQKYYEICGAKIDFNELVDKIKFFYNNRKNCKLYVKIADISLEPGEEEEFYNTFGDICDSMFVERIIPLFEGINYNQMLDEKEDINRWGQKTLKFDVCPPSLYQLNIKVNGDVIPCCDYFYHVIGNVNKKSLLELWNGEKRFEFLKMQLRKKRYENPICKKCSIDLSFRKEDNVDNYADEILHRLEKFRRNRLG